MKILMLHGINHKLFGKRDPARYGTVRGQICGFGMNRYLLALRAGVFAGKAATT